MRDDYPGGFEHDSPPTLAALNRLASGLRDSSDGIALEGAMTHYLADDLMMDYADADRLWGYLRQTIYLDDDVLYGDHTMAINHCRTLLVTEVMSMYRRTRSADDFMQWLPKAIQVAIPSEGVHHIEVCPRRLEEYEMSCDHGSCPVKGFVQTISQEVYSADFGSLAYQLDAAGEYQGVRTLLHTARRYLLLSEAEEDQLRRSYEGRLAGALLHIGNSTLRTDEKPV